MVERKTVSFNDEENYLLKFAEKHGKFATVVKDMLKEKYNDSKGLSDEVKNEIKAFIREELSKMDISVTEDKKEISKEDLEALAVLGMKRRDNEKKEI